MMHVTLAYNHFGKRLSQRMPRCRWGFFHIVNNDYTHWLMYAIGGSKGATIISQGNRFIAPPDPNFKEVNIYPTTHTYHIKLNEANYIMLSFIYMTLTHFKNNNVTVQVTHRNDASPQEWKNWTWRSEGDVMMNGAFMIQSGNPDWSRGYHDYQLIKPLPGTEVGRITQFSGSLGCRIKVPC